MFRFITLSVLSLFIGEVVSKHGSPFGGYLYAAQKEIVEVKAGVPFEVDDLVITISGVEYQQDLVGHYLGQPKYFYNSPVELTITNNHAGKIINWKGCYYTASLEDEHGNKFGGKNTLGWTFPFSVFHPDLDAVGIDPKETIHRAIYFREIPRTSKKFKLTIPLNGKKIVCVGDVGEREKRDKERRDKEEMVKRKDEEKMEKENLKKKEAAEARGESVYPQPTTEYGNKNAKEWFNVISDPDVGPHGIKAGLTALAALKAESIPFLLELLEEEKSHQGRQVLLSGLYPKGIHPNDIPKVIKYLDKTQHQIATRVTALDILARSGKANKYKDKIQLLTKDLLTNPNVKEIVKTSLKAINNPD